MDFIRAFEGTAQNLHRLDRWLDLLGIGDRIWVRVGRRRYCYEGRRFRSGVRIMALVVHRLTRSYQLRCHGRLTSGQMDPNWMSTAAGKAPPSCECGLTRASHLAPGGAEHSNIRIHALNLTCPTPRGPSWREAISANPSEIRGVAEIRFFLSRLCRHFSAIRAMDRFGRPCGLRLETPPAPGSRLAKVSNAGR